MCETEVNRSQSHEKSELRSQSHTHENQELWRWSRSHVHEKKSSGTGAMSLLRWLRSPESNNGHYHNHIKVAKARIHKNSKKYTKQ